MTIFCYRNVINIITVVVVIIICMDKQLALQVSASVTCMGVLSADMVVKPQMSLK